jgi:chitinase
VGLCSIGNNQSSPAAGCDTLLTSGLATYQTIENLPNNGYQTDGKINQKQS